MPRRVRVRSSRSSVRRRWCAVVSTRSVVEQGAAGSGAGVGSDAGATPMTGMPTGEVEADPADGVEAGVEAGEEAADEADASVAAVGGTAGGSVSAGASVRPADDEGEPGAASVIGPILEVNPVQALLRREDPRV